LVPWKKEEVEVTQQKKKVEYENKIYRTSTGKKGNHNRKFIAEGKGTKEDYPPLTEGEVR